MKAVVIKDCNLPYNDYNYKVGEYVDVIELDSFESYAIYQNFSLDWIPKDYVLLED